MPAGLRFAFGISLALGLLSAAASQVHAIAADHPDLSGFWEPRSGSVHRPGPPSYTPVAQEQLRKPSKDKDPNGVDAADTNCLPLGQPWNLYQSAPINIVQGDRETTMMYEARSLPWHIYTDGRPHPSASAFRPTLNGHSTGRWDGDTFVVDSVDFAAREGHGALFVLPNDATTHVIETFRLAANGQELHGHFRIEDTHWLKQPYEFDVVWYRDPPSAYAQVEVCDARDSANAHY